MADRIKLRRDTNDNWIDPTVNPVLSDGEPGYDKTLNVIKIGNGTDKWNDLQGLMGYLVGTTAERPSNPYRGYQYFDTTLGKPIWYDGSNWVDATGTSV